MRLGLIVLVSSFIFTGQALAAESDCVQLRDSDQRNLCMAKFRRSETYCTAINNEDQRRYCRALISHRESDCVAISDSQLRTYCRGVTQ